MLESTSSYKQDSSKVDTFGHPELLVMRKVSAVDVPEDFHVFMPSSIGFYEMEQVEHGLNVLLELMVHEGKSVSSDPLGYCNVKKK